MTTQYLNAQDYQNYGGDLLDVFGFGHRLHTCKRWFSGGLPFDLFANRLIGSCYTSRGHELRFCKKLKA